MADTVHAPATASGRAAIAVVRVSGPQAAVVLAALTPKPPPPRRASLRTIRGPGGEALDRGLVVWTPGPASFTGEDVFELHLHGGPAVVAAVMQALRAAGSRPAEAGEFTRRAFENGRLDLAEAEAVADLIDAQTEAQRRQALRQLDGAMGRKAAEWRARLIAALAHLEAAVDFPDEDLPSDVAARARPELAALRHDLAQAAGDERGERLRDGLRVALVGAPNAGKSSLLNALAGREAAIVTPIPGTTRDVVEVSLELAGVPVTLADTAGLRETEDMIEAEGVRRAEDWARAADLRLWIVDGANPTADRPSWLASGDVEVRSKSDLTRGYRSERSTWNIVTASAIAPGGVDALREWLQTWAEGFVAGAETSVVTRERHRRSLEAAVAHLDRAAYEPHPSVELLAEDVRLAARELERLTGRIEPEAVLGAVFSAFCIGK